MIYFDSYRQFEKYVIQIGYKIIEKMELDIVCKTECSTLSLDRYIIYYQESLLMLEERILNPPEFIFYKYQTNNRNKLDMALKLLDGSMVESFFLFDQNGPIDYTDFLCYACIAPEKINDIEIILDNPNSYYNKYFN